MKRKLATLATLIALSLGTAVMGAKPAEAACVTLGLMTYCFEDGQPGVKFDLKGWLCFWC